MNDFDAGLISGIVSCVICNPLDIIRTNKQLMNKIEYTPKFLTRGLLSGLITIPTFWSVYFYSYNKLKLINNENLSFLNGFIACNISSTISCPLFFIRQKNQSLNNFSIINHYKKNGLLSFYNGLLATYMINASFIIQMPIYEYLKQSDYLRFDYESTQNKFQISQSNQISQSKQIFQSKQSTSSEIFRIFLITSISKTIAVCIFYPLDTIRTLKRSADGKFTTYEIIKYLNNNPVRYYRGLFIYLLRSIPYHTSAFCTFEYCKKNY